MKAAETRRSRDERKPLPFGSGFSALGVTRTRGPLLRKQVLYPLSYEGMFGPALPNQAGREGFEPSVEALTPTSA